MGPSGESLPMTRYSAPYFERRSRSIERKTSESSSTLSNIGLATLRLPSSSGRLRRATLVPAVEERKVARVPCLAESRHAQIPVGTNFARRRAQIAPQFWERRASPKPVAVVEGVDHESRLEHQRVRNHRVVVRVGVLLNVEVLLNDSVRVREKRPLRTHRRTKFLNRVVLVGGDRSDLRVRNRDLRVIRGKLQMLLMLLRAIMAPRQRE